jgi:hypothetical protein
VSRSGPRLPLCAVLTALSFLNDLERITDLKYTPTDGESTSSSPKARHEHDIGRHKTTC